MKETWAPARLQTQAAVWIQTSVDIRAGETNCTQHKTRVCVWMEGNIISIIRFNRSDAITQIWGSPGEDSVSLSFTLRASFEWPLLFVIIVPPSHPSPIPIIFPSSYICFSAPLSALHPVLLSYVSYLFSLFCLDASVAPPLRSLSFLPSLVPSLKTCPLQWSGDTYITGLW